MIKVSLLALAGVATLSLSAFAADKSCCATTASANMKQSCEATFANLDLTSAQKTKMEKLAADCDKGGCNKESMAKMEKGAKGILSKDQFATWKASCSGKMGEKTQS
jgi:Spy/CpxP family protein refolding chaperone